MLLILLSFLVRGEQSELGSTKVLEDSVALNSNTVFSSNSNTSVEEISSPLSQANIIESNSTENDGPIKNSNYSDTIEISNLIQMDQNESNAVIGNENLQSETQINISVISESESDTEVLPQTKEQTPIRHEEPEAEPSAPNSVVENPNQHHDYYDWPGAKKCIGAHTRPNYEGGCQCEDGYSGGADPNVTGCWKCEKCHRLASCVAEGTCRCRAGFLGDGVSSCEQPAPKILRVEKPSPGQLAPVPVRVHYDAPGFTPSVAYCRFGAKKRVAALIHSDGSLSCLQPDKIRGSAPVSITFDGVRWSDPVDYEVVPGLIDPARTVRQLAPPPPAEGRGRPLMVAALAVAALALAAAAAYVSWKTPAPERRSSDERVPLLEDSRKRV